MEVALSFLELDEVFNGDDVLRFDNEGLLFLIGLFFIDFIRTLMLYNNNNQYNIRPLQ